MKNAFHILLALLVVAGLNTPAKASTFYECDVNAKVKASAVQEGQYDIHIKRSIITDGSASIGSPCFSIFTFTKTAEIQGEDIPVNEMITLKFRSYSGMGSEGPVSSEIWIYEDNKEESGDK
ncbi:MAG: hypothetical protein ACLFR0_00600 [Alphaproteobacteria bacterium]